MDTATTGTSERPTYFAREARVVYEKKAPGERVLGSKIQGSADAAQHVSRAIGSPCVEHFVVVALDARLRTVGWSTIGIGTISACPVDMTQIARFAVLAGAASVILGHNHPSGDPSPSAEDIVLTERAAKALEILGIRVLDHVIIGDGSSFSFLDAGLIRTGGGR